MHNDESRGEDAAIPTSQGAEADETPPLVRAMRCIKVVR